MEQQNEGQNGQNGQNGHHPAAAPELHLEAMSAHTQDMANMGMPDPSMVMAGQHFATESMPLGGAGFMMPAMMPNGGVPGLLQPNSISADDIALYDRQIRLWGMDAQARIQNASILLITMRGLANEVAKNLALAGVGSITLLDGSPVTEADLGAQFLLSDGDDHIGENRAAAASASLRKLNPRVNVHVDPESVTAKGPSYFAGFDVVIATDLDPDTFNIINTATRINGRAFYAAGTHGMYGFIFSDLIEHDYVIEREMGNIATQPAQETRTRSIVDVKTRKDGPKTIESVTKRELYSTWFLASDLAALPHEFTSSKRRLKGVSPTLSCLRALWEFKQLKGGALPSNREDLKLFTQIATQKHKALSLPSETLRPEVLRSFLQNLGSEIAPVTAILGGQLAQDVINVLGHREQPIQNMVVFDGEKLGAEIYPLHPEGALGASLLSGMGMNLDAGSFNAMPPPDGFPVGDGSLAHGNGVMMGGNENAGAQDMSALEANHSQQANAPAADQSASTHEQPSEAAEGAAAA